MPDEPEKPTSARGPGDPPFAAPLTIGCLGLFLLGLGSLGGCMAFARGDETQFYLEYNYLAQGAYARLWYPEQVAMGIYTGVFFAGCALLGLAWLRRDRTFSLRRLTLTVLLVGALGSFAFFMDDLRPKDGLLLVRFEKSLSPTDRAELRERLEAREALPELRDALGAAHCHWPAEQNWDIYCEIRFPAGTSVAGCRRVGEALEKHVEAVAGEYAAKHGLPPLKDEHLQRSTARWER